MAFDKYGLKLSGDHDPRLVELGLYASDDLRRRARHPLSKWEHLRNCIKGFLPDEVFRWHRWVDDFGEAWCEHSGVAVWGAGGTTKSGILGCFAFFDLLAVPKDTLHVMITNPLEKHWDRAFSKVLMWRAAMPEHLRIGRLVKSPKPSLMTVESDSGSRRGIVCVSIEPGETADQIAKKVGAHAPRTRLSLDEGQGLPESAIDIGVNLFIGSTDRKGIVIGNPTTWSGNSLGAASMPMDGDTDKIDREQPDTWFSKWTWDDRPGKTLVFDGTKCPTYDSPSEAKRLFMMIQPRDVETRRSRPGGEKSLLFWQQVKGRIAPQGSCTTLFNTLDWREHGIGQLREFSGPVERKVVGCDVSLGGDAIPVYRFDIGPNKELGRIMQQVARKHIVIDTTAPNRTRQIAIQFKQIVHDEWGIDIEDCAIESSGQQGAIVDAIEEEMNKATGRKNGRAYRIRTEEAVTTRILSNGRVHRASDDDKKSQRETAKDRYKDRKTEVLLNIVELFEDQRLYGLDDDVKFQLCSRGYNEDNEDGGKCEVQKKKPWRQANGDKSPDELDAVACAVTMVLERKILVPGREGVVPLAPKSTLPQWMDPRKNSRPKMRNSASRVSVCMRRRG